MIAPRAWIRRSSWPAKCDNAFIVWVELGNDRMLAFKYGGGYTVVRGEDAASILESLTNSHMFIEVSDG